MVAGLVIGFGGIVIIFYQTVSYEILLSELFNNPLQTNSKQKLSALSWLLCLG
jgi:hypothetical protein